MFSIQFKLIQCLILNSSERSYFFLIDFSIQKKEVHWIYCFFVTGVIQSLITKAMGRGLHILLAFPTDANTERRHMSEIRKQLGTLGIFLNNWMY